MLQSRINHVMECTGTKLSAVDVQDHINKLRRSQRIAFEDTFVWSDDGTRCVRFYQVETY